MSNKEIVETLKTLKEKRYNNLWGICSNLEEILVGRYDHYCKVTDKMQNWPKYSGNRSYTVPSANKRLNPWQAYRNAQDNNTMWSKRSAYGRLRHELLDWLIAEFSK